MICANGQPAIAFYRPSREDEKDISVSQNPGWEPQDNFSAGQEPRPVPPGFPAQERPPLPGMAAPGMPGLPVPAGMYFDAAAGLTLPNGTELASHGRRVEDGRLPLHDALRVGRADLSQGVDL